MAATKNLIGYGTAAQVTCGLASLAAGSTRESAVVTNTATTAEYFDYLVSLTFSMVTTSPTGNQQVNIYANGSVDNTLWPIIQLSSGATYTSGAGDASVGALASPSNLRLIGTFALLTNSSASERTYRTEPMSVASAFSGVLPEAFSIFVENQTGVAFSSSTQTTANYLEVTGIYTTSGN